MPSATPPSSASPAPGFRGGLFLWLTAFVAALGGLLFGYDWVVIGGAAPFYEKFFALGAPEDRGWAQSCALIGCLAGAMVSGRLSDRFGRKPMLTLAALLFTVTSLGVGLASSFKGFIAWRMAGGLAIGLASNLSPLYIAEIAPAAIRGRLVSMNQLTIVIGILLAQLVNLGIAGVFPGWLGKAADAMAAQAWNESYGWRWMFGVTAVPSLLFLIGVFFIPESPRWLLGKGRCGEALRVLEKLGGEAAGDGASPGEGVGGWRALFEGRMPRILLLGIGLAVFQQWCGINVIFNYAGEIFGSAGYSIDETLQNIAWTGSVNLVFTIAAMLVVDRLGRRPLLLAGAAALFVVYVFVGWCYHSGVLGFPVLALVLAAIGSYAATLAPVTWVVISEIFPTRIRGTAMSVAVSFLWLACFLLTYTFPILNDRLGAAGTFWLYAAVCLGGFFLVKLRLPETKGRSLEELESVLMK